MRPKVITVANQKGGVGKTTTTITLAHGLALRGHETMIADLDPQGHCAGALGLDQEPGIFNLVVERKPLRDVVRTTGRSELFLLPGNKRTDWAKVILDREHPGSRDLLRSVFEDCFQNGGPECIVIDTAPSIGGFQEMALWAADLVVIPSATDSLSTDGVTKVVATLDNLNQHGWLGHVLGILPTFYDEVTKESQTILVELRQFYGDELILTPIHRATILRECVAHGKTIFEHAPNTRAAEEYAALVWKVLEYV